VNEETGGGEMRALGDEGDRWEERNRKQERESESESEIDWGRKRRRF